MQCPSRCTNGTERLKVVVMLVVVFSTQQSNNFTRKNSASYSGGRILVAARCKAWVCDCSLNGIACSNPTGGMMTVGSVVCCQI